MKRRMVAAAAALIVASAHAFAQSAGQETERQQLLKEKATLGNFQRAAALEAEGETRDAVKLYMVAARSGECKAALRLGQIYEGVPGVARDYGESLKWYNAARTLGCEVPTASR